MKKVKKQKHYVIDEDDYLYSTNSVASATECTGIAPSKINSEAEAESYTDIYDIAIDDTKRMTHLGKRKKDTSKR